MNAQELQIIAQLINNMNLVIDKLEKAYSEKNAENFNRSKQEILLYQRKIDEILKNEH